MVNYNLVINDLVLTAWGNCNQTFIIYGVIKFIGVPASPAAPAQGGCGSRGQSWDWKFSWADQVSSDIRTGCSRSQAAARSNDSKLLLKASQVSAITPTPPPPTRVLFLFPFHPPVSPPFPSILNGIILSSIFELDLQPQQQLSSVTSPPRALLM